ncbi:MAG: PRC-barrel domain-containing protein [Longimicrobiales bacterium]
MERAGTLIELDEAAQLRIAPDEPDPRGWSVVSREGCSVGVVRTLLVDTERLKVRYFVSDLSENEGQVLLPVPLARLDPRQRRVIYDVSPAAVFSSLPRYSGSSPTEHDEDHILSLLAGTASVPPDRGATTERRQRDRRRGSAR